LNDQRELKIKCYGSVAIRVKPLVTGTSTRLFKAQTASSLLTPGKTLTDATAPMHGVLPTILPFGKVTKALPLQEGVPRRGEGVVTSTLFFTEERSDEASRYHKVDVTEILRYALDDKRKNCTKL